jgi:hypothetical protein
MKRSLTVTAVLAAALLFLSSAYAGPITQSYDLSTNNGCCGVGPYGTVTLTQNGANEVDFTVSLNDPNQFIWGGQDGVFAFNLNVSPGSLNISVSDASVLAGFSATAVGGTPQSEHMAAFGKFNYAITGDANHTQGGSTPLGAALAFSVLDVSGPISISDFEVDSSKGGIASYFAADIMVGQSDGGFVGSGGSATLIPVSSTPEPATLVIAGAGLVGLGLLRRRRTSSCK